MIQVDLSVEHQSGIDWSYVSSSLGGANVSLTGAPLLSGSTTPGAFGFKSSDQQNSQLLIKVLEKFGRVSTSYSSVVTTVNRQPVPVGVLNTLSYLKSITPATTSTVSASGVLSSGAVGLVPGEITTGFSMNLIPMVLDSNRILLQCSISISSLRELIKFSSGTGDSAQSVQQPNVDTFASLQRMTMNSGETMVIMGFDRNESSSSQVDILKNSLPGSKLSTNNKKSTIVLITPSLLGV